MAYLLSALRALFVAFVLLLAAPAWAQGDAILLLVHGDELPKERLRDAIAAELKKPVAIDAGAGGAGGVVTVTYRAATRELAVTWDGPKRGTVSRVVSAADKVDDVVRDAALLAGNLARDEADELLGPKPPPPVEPAEPAALPPLPPPIEPSTPSSPGADRPTPPARDPNDRDFNLGVIYPLATNFGRPQVKTKFDWNLFSSRIGELDGFQLGGANVVGRDASGVQIGWIANVVGGTAAGWQVAPFVNRAGALEGIQTAALVNTAGRASGGQVALVNLSGDLDGAQVGLVNVGGHVRGATVGLVNVADSIDGVPVGLASITKDGGIHPRAWSSNASFANLGLKLATRHTYTMPSLHYHRAYQHDFYGAGFTIGGHIPFRAVDNGPYLDTELAFSWLYAPERSIPSSSQNTYHQHLLQPRLRAMLGWRFVEHFSVFAGAGLLTQVRFLDDGDRALIRIGPEFVAGVEL
ncbi:MAG: hypothetical protein KIT84_40305 [Labilithrix sp.]|nr:hypothetical protein [Labilithrix sp.]MCW5817310.1 hypothetical protein [Labilithrix sp.]